MRNFASYAMPLIWNSLPLQTKRITSINALKKNYTATLMSNYATECNIANCFSCNNWILSIWTWPFDICFCSLCINHVCSLLCLTQPPPRLYLVPLGSFCRISQISFRNRDKKYPKQQIIRYLVPSCYFCKYFNVKDDYTCLLYSNKYILFYSILSNFVDNWMTLIY